MGKAYLGSKATAGLCQPLIGMMPPHDVYIESHLGGGAIMKRKPPAMLNIGIDREERAVQEFRCDYPVELVHGCCHGFLEEYPFEGRELVYSDPPYLKSTRKAPERYRYRYDYEERDHVELLGILKSLPCQVMLSGYASALYDEMLAGWRRLELQVMNQAGVVTEVVWYNFEIDRLHWSRHAGNTPNQRQDVRRKAERWGRRYRRMPRAERIAMLAAIMAVEAEG
ncbi:MAG: DNA methylase [Gammaproteobacteria bacterium]|nr:DNA methylase [Gammaproteobacteria bacterium]